MNERKEMISLLFEGYKKRREEGTLYDNDKTVPKLIIDTYIRNVEKPAFSHLINLYKHNYIVCESRVEPNFTKEEQQGLADVYDYIQNYDFSKFSDIFTLSLIIHNKLYAHCGDGTFGGNLRQTTAVLFDTNYEVADPEVAKREINNYIPKKDFIFDKLKQGDVFGYIDDCIKLVVDLTKLQPFADGNKRTYRSILNLLLKAINVPPIYIPKKEREEYKNALLKAVKTDDYSDINQFYYYKICDAIVNLDIKHSELIDENETKKIH